MVEYLGLVTSLQGVPSAYEQYLVLVNPSKVFDHPSYPVNATEHSHLAFLEALNLALKSPPPPPPASLDVAVVMTAEHDDDRPLLLEDEAAAASVSVGAGPERARFRRELRLARNPNMVTAGHFTVGHSHM